MPRARKEIDLTSFLPHRLGLLSRLTQDMLGRALAECGLTIPQWRVCICLTKEGPSTLNEIVAFTVLPQSSLSRTISRMEQLELVQSRPHKGDRRQVLIDITKKGRNTLEGAIVVVDTYCARQLDLADREKEQFLETINRLIAKLRQSD